MTSGVRYGAKWGRFVQVELDWAKCGTAANYQAHLRRGQKPCRACRQAERERKERRKLKGYGAA